MKNSLKLKIMLSIISAIFIAFIITLLINYKNYKVTENLETNNKIKNNNEFTLIQKKEKVEKESINNDFKEINNQIENKKDETINNILETESIKEDLQENSENLKNEIIVEENKEIENILKNLEEQNIEINKINNEDLEFLINLVSIADNVTLNYNEILSYALSSSFDKGKSQINLLQNNYNELQNLNTNNSELKEVKKVYLDGIQSFIDGFNQYFNYENKANDSFIKADTYFYNAQILLKDFLNKYKINM